ncbi:MAG TPA: hypothetical protein VJR48_07600 [Ktedonobacterales bacterium]|nr:hypothetical protein [Ktedonobacterales bacterium]
MKHSLLTTYRLGWQDGCDAARGSRFSTAQATRDAHLYMDLAVLIWGLTPRAGVRLFDAYHRGFVRGGTCKECAPLSVTPPRL